MVMSSLGSDGEGYGLSCFLKDTYYRLMVLLYRSKGAFRLLLISSEAPDEITWLSLRWLAQQQKRLVKLSPERYLDWLTQKITLYFRIHQHYSLCVLSGMHVYLLWGLPSVWTQVFWGKEIPKMSEGNANRNFICIISCVLSNLSTLFFFFFSF